MTTSAATAPPKSAARESLPRSSCTLTSFYPSRRPVSGLFSTGAQWVQVVEDARATADGVTAPDGLGDVLLGPADGGGQRGARRQARGDRRRERAAGAVRVRGRDPGDSQLHGLASVEE